MVAKKRTKKTEWKQPAIRPSETLNLDPTIIRPSAFQPRRDFDGEKLASLGASMLDHGQASSISVRSIPGGGFELLAGERRLRAAVLVKMAALRADVYDCTDTQARQIVLIENLHREDLNAIEEASAFRAAIDAGDAAGPTELAQQLGLSQGHVSNRLRLLELPEKVRAKVISREISPTAARALVPFAVVDAVIKRVLKSVDACNADGEAMSVGEFSDVIECAVRGACRLIDRVGPTYDYVAGYQIPPLKLSDEQKATLGIITYTPPGRGSKPIEYATNTKLYDQLYEAHKKATIERAKKKKAGKKAGGTPDDKKKPLNVTEKKRLREEETRRAKERAEKLARGLWAVAIDWRRWLVAETLRGKATAGGTIASVGVSTEDVLRLCLYFASSNDWRRYGCDCSILPSYRNATERFDMRALILWNGMVAAGYRKGCKNGRPDLFPALTAGADELVLEKAAEFLASLFWSEDYGPQTMPDATLLAITEQLGIDLAAAWKKDAAGPLTERWLELRTKEQLGELEKSFRLEPKMVLKSKADHVAALLKIARHQKPPAELIKPKKPKR